MSKLSLRILQNKIKLKFDDYAFMEISWAWGKMNNREPMDANINVMLFCDGFSYHRRFGQPFNISPCGQQKVFY